MNYEMINTDIYFYCGKISRINRKDNPYKNMGSYFTVMQVMEDYVCSSCASRYSLLEYCKILYTSLKED